MRRTSGNLQFYDVKGLHVVTAEFWIDLGINWHGCAFQLRGHDWQAIAGMNNYGRLFMYPGYPYDGSSGPTLDGVADPVPAGVHDVLYEAMRAGKLDVALRPLADATYRDLLIERGMSKARAWTRWAGLRLFGRWAASRMRGPQYPHRTAA